MPEFVRLLFDPSDFTPRAHCGYWTDGLIALHVASDLLIWLAYLAIPTALVGIAVRRAIPLQRVFVLIAAFVVFCGFTHLLDALMFQTPVYRAAGLLKAATAVVSWGVLVALIPLLPRALTALDLAARQDLLDRLRLLEAAVERTDDAVLVTAPGPGGPADQRVVYANPAFERQTGFPPSEVLGQAPDVLLGPDSRPADRAALRDGIAAGRPFKAELKGRRRDGSAYWADVSLSPVGADGPPRWVGIQRDVTDRRALEVQLRQAQKLEAVGRLAGGVAHDFNNILTVVRGAADLLRAAPPGSEQARGLTDEVGRAADRAAGLVRQLLAFSKAGPSNPGPLDLAATAADLAGMLRRLIGDAVTLSVDRPPGPVPVVADKTQIEQVVVNLVVNARDALPAGGRVTVVVSEWVETDGKRWARLIVSDAGMGMDSATAARAFEPFFTTKGPGKGTGLGLATVYGIVSRAGGRVGVDTAPGAGTRVRIDLPWSAAPAATPVEADPPHPAAGGGRTVLLVEDEDVVRSLARMVLESAGYVVTEAADGAEALAKLAAGPAPDLVVTDLTMPGADGRDVALRAAALGTGVGVVIVSGYAPDAERLVEETGAVFLHKPYSPADLIRAADEASTVLKLTAKQIGMMTSYTVGG